MIRILLFAVMCFIVDHAVGDEVASRMSQRRAVQFAEDLASGRIPLSELRNAVPWLRSLGPDGAPAAPIFADIIYTHVKRPAVGDLQLTFPANQAAFRNIAPLIDWVGTMSSKTAEVVPILQATLHQTDPSFIEAHLVAAILRLDPTNKAAKLRLDQIAGADRMHDFVLAVDRAGEATALRFAQGNDGRLAIPAARALHDISNADSTKADAVQALKRWLSVPEHAFDAASALMSLNTSTTDKRTATPVLVAVATDSFDGNLDRRISAAAMLSSLLLLENDQAAEVADAMRHVARDEQAADHYRQIAAIYADEFDASARSSGRRARVAVKLLEELKTDTPESVIGTDVSVPVTVLEKIEFADEPPIEDSGKIRATLINAILARARRFEGEPNMVVREALMTLISDEAETCEFARYYVERHRSHQ